jgi:pimeloyl-ACP methyl ester carboxylesterase
MGDRAWLSNLEVLLPWSPYWIQSWKHRLARAAYLLLVLYVGVLVLLLALENWFLFQGKTAAQEWNAPPPGVEETVLTSADGTPIHTWFTAPAGWKPEAGALLYSHGNAGNLSGRADMILFLQEQLGTAVLIYDYPGYGKSGGKPSEAGCYAAGDAAYAYLTEVKKVSGERIILYGGSLGGAMAIEMATHHPHRAVVLVATFTSFPDMAQFNFPWLPGRWLVRNQFLSINKIKTLHTPIFIAHGTADQIVPFKQGERLFASANEPKQFLKMDGVNHDEIQGAIVVSLKKFLEERAPLPQEGGGQ